MQWAETQAVSRLLLACANKRHLRCQVHPVNDPDRRLQANQSLSRHIAPSDRVVCLSESNLVLTVDLVEVNVVRLQPPQAGITG